jgi:hypothetical protein
VVGTRDEELVLEDGKDICLLIMHTGNSCGNVLAWSFMDSEVIKLTSPRSYGFS